MLKSCGVEKRAGRRCVIKRRPAKSGGNAQSFYLDQTKTSGIFPRKISDCRFVICSDFSPSDMMALTMFAAWIKTNERYYDSRNNFPIHSFVTQLNSENASIKSQRAREFLWEFNKLMGWDESDHHLYPQYLSAGSRVWTDVACDACNAWPSEKQLVRNQEALVSDDYPKTNAFVGLGVGLVGIDEVMKVKASNLFIIYLNPQRLLRSIADRPDVVKYLKNVPGAMYLSSERDTSDFFHDFVNRGPKDAPLIYTETSFCVDATYEMLRAETCPKLFDTLSDTTDEADYVAYFEKTINDAMFSWNDSVTTLHVKQLEEYAEFDGADFDDYESFSSHAEKLSSEQREKLSVPLTMLNSLLKNNNRCVCLSSQLAMIGILMGTGTLKTPLLQLERSIIVRSAMTVPTIYCATSNTHVLMSKDLTKSADVHALVDSMMHHAFAVVV